MPSLIDMTNPRKDIETVFISWHGILEGRGSADLQGITIQTVRGDNFDEGTYTAVYRSFAPGHGGM